MGKLLLFKYIFMVVWMCCCANVAPNTKACIDNYELSFFCDLQNFNKARDVCKNKRSYLVKIDNANMTEIIRNTIAQMSCNVDFHAGAAADGNRNWTWLDESRVIMRGEPGYQNWKSNQPNDFGGREDCLKIERTTTKWLDSPCTGKGEKRHYICQKDLKLKIEIQDSSDNTLECSENSGTCVNQVEWLQNNKTVSTSKNHSVYQEISSGRTILHYENATINDVGEYYCVTWVSQNEANRVSALATVKVDGTPSIHKTTSSPCNTSLMIFWNPNLTAIGFPHRIKLYDSMSGNQVKDIAETPIENAPQVTQISRLRPNLAYHIQITACKDEKTCTDEHTTNATATTWGIIINNATMRQIDDNDTCMVTWNWSYNISTVFRLNINSGSGVNSSNVERPVNYIDDKISYFFEMQPEQIYEIQIHVNGSEKFCLEPVNVAGSCRGREPSFTSNSDEAKAPSDITMVVIPVSIGVFVILIIFVIVVCFKRRKSQDPIHGVTNNVASESTYDHLHSSSDKQTSNQPGDSRSTRNGSELSPEVVFNPLYGDIGMDTFFDNHNIDAEANTEAPVYAAICRSNNKIPNNVSPSVEHDSESPPSTTKQDDDVYAVVDKEKRKN